MFYLPIAIVLGFLSYLIAGFANGGITWITDRLPLGGFEDLLAIPFRLVIAGVPGAALGFFGVMAPSLFATRSWSLSHWVSAFFALLAVGLILAIGAWMVNSLFHQGGQVEIFSLALTYLPPMLGALAALFIIAVPTAK